MERDMTVSEAASPQGGNIIRRDSKDYYPYEFAVGNRIVDVRNPNPYDIDAERAQHLVRLKGDVSQIEQITATYAIPTALLRGGLDGISPENLAQIYKQIYQRDGGEPPIPLTEGADVHTVVAAIADHHAPSGGVILIQPDLGPKATNPESKSKNSEDVSAMQQAVEVVGDGFKRAKQAIRRRNRPDFRDPDVLKKLEELAKKLPVRVILIGNETSGGNTKLAQLLRDINIEPVYVLGTIYPQNQEAELTPAIAAQYNEIVEAIERDTAESTTS